MCKQDEECGSVSSAPEILSFESNEDAFQYSCGMAKSSYGRGDVVLGIVVDVDNGENEAETAPIYKLKLQSPCGGRIIPGAVPSYNVPVLKQGNLVMFEVFADYTPQSSGILTGMVGVIITKVAARLHKGHGWQE